MNGFVLNVLLGMAWIALTGEFTPENFVFGFLVGLLALRLSWRNNGEAGYWVKLPKVISFLLFFLWQIFVANLRVAYLVLSPQMRIKPAVIAVPLDARSGIELTLLANVITLTPGTLYLDCSGDGNLMFVHTIYVDDIDEFRRNIKEGFERRLLEILR